MACNQWREIPTVNPNTGRKIKKGGPTYNKLKASCEKSLSHVDTRKMTTRTMEVHASLNMYETWDSFVSKMTGGLVMNEKEFSYIRFDGDLLSDFWITIMDNMEITMPDFPHVFIDDEFRIDLIDGIKHDLDLNEESSKR